MKKHKRITYEPPPATAMQRLARDTCSKLAQSDETFAQPEVAYGLEGFLRAVAKAYCKHLSTESEEEN